MENASTPRTFHATGCAVVGIIVPDHTRKHRQRLSSRAVAHIAPESLLNETLVVWATEFGRSFSAVENRHYVTDIHATVLHQLGLDSRRLEIPGRKRLDIEHGHVIREILA